MERWNRRLRPYISKKLRRETATSQNLNTKNNQIIQSSLLPNMNRSPTNSFDRECSWVDSDSATEESEEEFSAGIQDTYPPTQPISRTRISHSVRATRQEMNDRRAHEANDCVVGLLLDFRRFSTQTIQNHIDRQWENTGEVTVIGRDEDRYLIHLGNEEDRRQALEQTPWNFEGALFATARWIPNTPLRDIKIDTIQMWMQI
ncbi:hypothetical protein COLO4_10409 [Corchorus olitorius]|uniref:DUF4283 domain-containing protein n=1 Tax=Corchorus olitorius TaxID=93759 RepID=A0A1R3K8Q5_9ROSI|nr:hypothetical protein COLO4_10409 [Corchorus olitorius]